MDSEERLSQQISDIQQVAQENKNIDVSALMLAALERHEQNAVSSKAKRWAYLISIGAPPLGLLFALKYYFGDQDDAKHVALMCLILTVFSVVMFLVVAQTLISSSGTSVQQIEQIKPSDIYQLSQ